MKRAGRWLRQPWVISFLRPSSPWVSMMRYQCVSRSAKVVLAASPASKMLRSPAAPGPRLPQCAPPAGPPGVPREGIVQFGRGGGGHVVHPGGDGERGPPRFASGVEVCPDRGQQPQADLLRTVAAHLGRGVSQRRVGEAFQDLGAVRCAVQAGGEADGGEGVLSHHAAAGRTEGVLPHGVADGLLAGGQAKVGEHGMAGVEQAQLGRLPRGDVGAEQRPGFLPRGPARGEVVLDDPLHEGFGHHGGLVPEAEFTFDGVKVTRRGGRHHPVHHGAREGHVGVQPGQQRPGFRGGQGGGEGVDQGSGSAPRCLEGCRTRPR